MEPCTADRFLHRGTGRILRREPAASKAPKPPPHEPAASPTPKAQVHKIRYNTKTKNFVIE